MWFAAGQVSEARPTRKAVAQPNVVVYVDHNPDNWQYLDFVVKHFGQTPAYGMSATCVPFSDRSRSCLVDGFAYALNDCWHRVRRGDALGSVLVDLAQRRQPRLGGDVTNHSKSGVGSAGHGSRRSGWPFIRIILVWSRFRQSGQRSSMLRRKVSLAYSSPSPLAGRCRLDSREERGAWLLGAPDVSTCTRRPGGELLPLRASIVGDCLLGVCNTAQLPALRRTIFVTAETSSVKGLKPMCRISRTEI